MTAAVAKHVRVHVAESRLSAGLLDDVIHVLTRHLPTLRTQEQPREVAFPGPKVSAERSQLIAFQWLVRT
jgi:hypothetical protein